MSRSDPYQARARELAVAAGLNPDDKVERPGLRPMPVWCNYRQAARDEHIAREAAALTVTLAPQKPEYQNSPLLVLGQHDDGTIAQMRNCMQVGNAVAGVICADGHLGYAQPVGGVIAYEKQISISGVGFDIGCFTGDTKVFTLDGRSSEMRSLVGREFHVLASRSDGTPVAAKATASLTRKNAALVCVTLDDGECIRCTPDHEFMLRDGTYCRAADLVAGQSLMPFYRLEDEHGYVLVRNNKARHPQQLHWIVARSGLLGKIPSYVGDKAVIHHKNYTPGNNDPGNLEFMPKKAHDALHAAERDLSYTKTPEFENKRIAAIKAFWEKARRDPVFMKRRAEISVRTLRGAPEAVARNLAAAGKRGRAGLIAYNRSEKAKTNAARRAAEGSSCPICSAPLKATNSVALHIKRHHPEAATVDNHKVAKVEVLTEREDVYCLHVPEHHNFALAAGVFVHNCGNMAVRLDTKFSDVKDKVLPLAQDIAKTISFGVGRTNDERVAHVLFDDAEAWKASDMEDYRQKAMTQLGTVGSGNHYVDLMEDEEGFVWIGVHFGSRGLGHTSATKYLKLAGGKDGMNVPPSVVDEDSELGQRYIAAMELAGRYAYAGREWVVERVRQMIGGAVTDSIHNHHNYAWRETHDDKNLWVVRKGATPAFPGQRGFVGGSMGDDAVILEGVSSPEAKAALYSTVHGAGRVFGRKEAKRRFARPEMDQWLHRRGVTLIGADLDESPMAYRRLDEVLAHHAASARVVHRLKPFVVVMAGEAEFDPFKD